MKKKLLVIAAISFSYLAAQTTATFEIFSLGMDTFLNGSNLQGGYSSGNVFLNNTYDPGFNSWFGFSISSKTDVTTPGYTNEFSCISGEGFANSNTYAVAYMSYFTNNAVFSLENNASGKVLEGLYVNNSTYAFLSMRDGDFDAKNFGGISGNDPDFFLLTIKKYLNGVESSNQIDFYLADFRFTNNTQDYILDEWTYLDLSSLGNADSLSFSLSSSDVGQFGMNTPAYFCLDNVITKDELATGIRGDLSSLELSFSPNPVLDVLQIRNLENRKGLVSIKTSLGQIVYFGALEASNQKLDIATYASGVYFIEIAISNGETAKAQFLKK